MYFWKIESLKQDIRADLFTDKNLIPYVVLYIGCCVAAIEMNGYLPYEDINLWTYLQSTLFILIPIAGTIYAYSCNGGANGEGFASKYFSIGFVVGIRFVVFLIPIVVLMIIYWLVMFPEQEVFPTTFLEVLVLSSWYALAYFRIAKHIGDTVKV